MPDMPMAPVLSIVAPDVARHPPLLKGTQRRLGGRLHDKMKMIRHETEANTLTGNLNFAVASKSRKTV